MEEKKKITAEQLRIGWPAKTPEGVIGTVWDTVWEGTAWFVSSEGRGEGPIWYADIHPY